MQTPWTSPFGNAEFSVSGSLQIFVIHYDKLIERRKNIVTQLMTNRLFADFVTQYDRNKLKESDKTIFKIGYGDADKAITLSHLYCYREIIDKHDFALILEDDAIFNHTFNDNLNHYLSQLPSDWDMLFIGDGCNLHMLYEITMLTKGNIFKKCLEPTSWGGNGATRCTDSYLISKKCAQKIINHIDQPGYLIDNTIDWWLNNICRHFQFNVYWAEPTIVTQGSAKNMFSTSRN